MSCRGVCWLSVFAGRCGGLTERVLPPQHVSLGGAAGMKEQDKTPSNMDVETEKRAAPNRDRTH